MRLQQSFRRLAVVILSLSLGLSCLPLSGAAVSPEEVSGIPENGVLSEIEITISAIPSEAQLCGLREDAASKIPDGSVFYGWVITDTSGSHMVADSEMEAFLDSIYNAPLAQPCKLTMQYLYIPENCDVEQLTPEESQPEDSGGRVETFFEELPTDAAQEPEEDDTDFSTVPLYFQNDYPDTMFGSGTIATSGCSITSLAMVATYMTDHEYRPDELARYFGGRAINNVARLEYGSEAMKLCFHKTVNWHETYRALQQGKIAIALMESNSIFTSSQHFIVLTGINENGKIMVNDSNRDNYSNWQLEKAFQEGFDPEDILLGYSGAWVYDKSAMPEDPFIYYEEPLDHSNPRYPDIHLTVDEIRLLAKVVWVEAQGESAEGQQAVAEVALNRIASGHFPDNLHDVIYGEGQFRSVPKLDKAEPFQAQYDAIERAIYGPYVLPEDVVYFATYKTNNDVWGKIGGHIFCRYGNGEQS